MKKAFLFISFCFLTFLSWSQEKSITTYYFVRHAEKVVSKTDRNPELQPKGELRAHQWARVLKNIPLGAVYSTDYKRTKATAQPAAESKGLDITLYHPKNIDYQQFLKDTKGKTVLIVGHSNTIPNFVNQVIGKNKYQDIEYNNNSNLYMVTIIDDVIIDQVLYIE